MNSITPAIPSPDRRPGDLSSAAGAAVERVSAGAHDVVNRAASVAAPAVDRLARDAHEAVDAAAGAAGAAIERVERGATRLSAAGERLAASSRGYITEHPLAAIGIAAGVGLLFGLLARR